MSWEDVRHTYILKHLDILVCIGVWPFVTAIVLVMFYLLVHSKFFLTLKRDVWTNLLTLFCTFFVPVYFQVQLLSARTEFSLLFPL